LRNFKLLNPLTQSHCSIIAITGLDGHAYGSWKGKRTGQMWLRDFLSKDFPRCRTMIYGYNSKLSSHSINTIMDYGRELTEEITKVRDTEEVRAVGVVSPALPTPVSPVTPTTLVRAFLGDTRNYKRCWQCNS